MAEVNPGHLNCLGGMQSKRQKGCGTAFHGAQEAFTTTKAVLLHL